MEQLPANSSALLTLAFALGVRHGFEPGQLDTIDVRPASMQSTPGARGVK
ncbi:MAG: hypothetical protein U0997_12530 [Sulfurimicrobium sp.]|nr:hypothetical protein [Sulfurimicrobium sp.]MDZ7656762.1 hypothetical protein [Sulfurimicrobium sp.]